MWLASCHLWSLSLLLIRTRRYKLNYRKVKILIHPVELMIFLMNFHTRQMFNSIELKHLSLKKAQEKLTDQV
jgi:hypothetical protein